MTEPLIRDIADTARWVATYRARETEKPDAVFRDPFARALAGDRGEEIARALPFAEDNSWSFVARTYLFDRYIARLVTAGADLVVNLAAGLDTRPYRLQLPPTLRWIEVDLPEILESRSRCSPRRHRRARSSACRWICRTMTHGAAFSPGSGAMRRTRSSSPKACSSI